MTHAAVTIQITPTSEPPTPSWMGEVAAFAQVLTHIGLLKTIQEQVRFSRARFLAALDQASVEALRKAFQQDVLARTPFASAGGFWDRRGQQWLVGWMWMAPDKLPVNVPFRTWRRCRLLIGA
jgi:hypothetical protein